jgi:hypothetical protein
MAVAVRIERETPVDAIADLTATFDWLRKVEATTAREELARAQGEGSLTDPVTYVDGRKTDDVDSVKPFGTITYVSQMGPVAAAIAMADGYARQAAPYRTGFYLEHMVWLVNGRPVSGPPSADQVGIRGNAQLVDLVPYASWLETQVPSGIVFGAFTQLRRAFGKALAIRYSYIDPNKLGGQPQRPGNPNPAGRTYMVPVLTIGNPDSTVRAGSTSRPVKGRIKPSDKRRGRGHNLARGRARSSTNKFRSGK